MQHELALVQRPVQGRAQLELLQRLRVHGRGVEAVGVAPSRLGLVHRGICALQQGVKGVSVIGPHGHAHRQAGGQFVALDLERLRQCLHHLGGHAIDGVHVLHTGQCNKKLVPALAADGVGVTDTVAQALRDLLQHLITHGVAQGVIDGLEMIQIQVQQRHLVARVLGPCHRQLKAIPKQHAVGQAGKWVMVRQEIDARLGLLALVDVLNEGQHQGLVFHIHQPSRNADMVNAARLAAPLAFVIQHRAVQTQLFQPSLACSQIDPQADLQRGVAHQVIAGPAEESFVFVVDLQEHAVGGPRNGGRQRAGRESHCEPLLGVAQRRDVLHGTGHGHRLARWIAGDLPHGQAHTHMAIGAPKAELHFIGFAVIERLLHGSTHPRLVQRIDMLQKQVEGGSHRPRRITKARKGFIAPTQFAAGHGPFPMPHVGQPRHLLHAAALLHGRRNVVDKLQLADAAVGVVQRHVEQLVGLALCIGPFPIHRFACVHIGVLAPVTRGLAAMEVLVALAPLHRAKLLLHGRVDVFDGVARVGDVNPVGQRIHDGHQARAVAGQLVCQILDTLDLADVGPGQHHAVVALALFLEGQHALEHPAPIGQAHLGFDACTCARTTLQIGQKDLLRPQPIVDIGHGPPNVCGPQGQVVLDPRADATQAQLRIQEHRADVGAVEQVVVVARERGELLVLGVQFAVEGVQVFVDGLELLVGALQLLVGGGELLVAQVDALVAGLQLHHHLLQTLTGRLQLGLQQMRRRLILAIGQGVVGYAGHGLRTLGGRVDHPGQRHALLAEQLGAAVQRGEGRGVERVDGLAGPQHQNAVRPERKMQLRQGLDLCFGLQVDQQVAAYGQVDAREGRVSQQVVPGKHHMATQRTVHPHGPLPLAHEVASLQRLRYGGQRVIVVLPARSHLQRLGAQVGGKHLDVAMEPHAPGHIQRQHGQGVGLLPRGAAGRPDAQVFAGRATAQQVGQHHLGQVRKR